MNTNRARGDYFERQARAALEAHGWVVIRAAGSLGPADLVALRAGKALFVSCKVTPRIDPAERYALVIAAEQAGARPLLAYRAKRGHVGLAVVSLAGKGPHVDTIKAPPRGRAGT